MREATRPHLPLIYKEEGPLIVQELLGAALRVGTAGHALNAPDATPPI
eukprot:gene52490-28766_t